MLKRENRSKVSLVAANQILIEACVFARNIIIARLIGADTLGEFIFLVLTIRLFAMSTDLAEDRFIIRADKDKLGQVLASIHFIAQARYLILTFLLLVMGLLNVKGVGFTSYMLLAGASLLRGFTHQGYRLHQRALNFRPALYVEGFTAVFGFVCLYFAAMLEPCLEVVCACMMAQAALHTALSHIMTDRRFKYQSMLYLDHMKELLTFGFPLLLTGAAMFWSMQGERLILSAMMEPADFAYFSMLFQLALVPVLIISRITINIGLPALSAVKDAWSQFQARMAYFHTYVYIIAIIYAVLFFMGANLALTTLFGPDFRADIGWVFFLAVAQALRLCRSPQSVAAQALGQTDIPLKANLVRIAFVLVAILAVLKGASILTLLILACIGEGAAWAMQGLLFSLRNRSRSAVARPAAMLKEA